MPLFSPGYRLRDRFVLVDRLGAGGMSEVWRATDELLGRPVAVKVLATKLAADPALRELTWREARAVARLSHPHVTQVHDYGEVPVAGGGVIGYLVMELVDGQTLAARLATAGPLPWPQAAELGRQVASALAAAHRLGVVHRDIKPGNVMLTESGAKVLDFGIAAVAGRADTDPGRLAGTPTYTAPERLRPGVPAAPASDIYSFGVLLHEALAGQPPVRLADWADAAAAHRAGSVPMTLPVTGLPEPLVRLCERCRSPDPTRRPTAGELVAALAELSAGSSASEAPGGDAATVLAPGGDAATVLAPGRFAPGSAQLPADPPGTPPTRIDSELAGQPGRPGRPGRPGKLRRLLAVAAAIVAAGLLVTLALVMLRPATEPPPGAGGDPSEPAQVGTAPATDPAPATAAPPDPADPIEVINAIDQAIADGFFDGSITRDGRDDLRDELDDLRDALTEDDPADRAEKLRDEAEDLREEIFDLLEDGEIDQPTAQLLSDLLAPLLN